jgi:membrane protein
MTVKKLTMVVSRIAKTLARFWQQGTLYVQRLDNHTHGWLGILMQAAQETFKPASAITAAAIAYMAVFALFPTTLLSIAIASFTLGPLVDSQLIVQKLEFIAPALGQLLGKNITEIVQARGPVTIFAIIGLIWSASTVFSTLTSTLNGIWGNKRRRPFWRQRGLAILFILIFVGPILFLASIASSMISNLLTWLPDKLIPVVGIGGLILAILLDVAFFMLVYLMLPH